MGFQANITRPTPATDLVVYGRKVDGTPSLMADGLQMPAYAPVVDTASSKWIDGEVATHVRTGNGVLGMKVRIEEATETAHDTIVSNFREALKQLEYTTTVVLNGRTWVFTCLPGSIAPASGPRQPWPAGAVIDWWVLQIPVMPNPEVS